MTNSIGSDIGARISEIWCDVLDVADVATDVNFFDAGGDSLLFIVLLERINRLVGRELDAAELFAYATIDAQTEYVIRLAVPA
jgi:aryl carrier-like protein